MHGILGVHVGADGAAVDLPGADLTKCRVAAGRAESDTALPAEIMYLANFAATGL